jgi:hypothetical protein
MGQEVDLNLERLVNAARRNCGVWSALSWVGQFGVLVMLEYESFKSSTAASSVFPFHFDVAWLMTVLPSSSRSKDILGLSLMSQQTCG